MSKVEFNYKAVTADKVDALIAKAEKMQQEAANDPAKAKLISVSKEDLSKLKAIA